MEHVENRIFHERESVECSGKRFQNCDFQTRLTLVFSGTGDVEFYKCRFGSCITIRCTPAPEAAT
jgi:hypothetical protein